MPENAPAPIVFLDTETTGLHPNRRPWEIAMIRRPALPGQADNVTILVEDVDLSFADLRALQIGRFYERHTRLDALVSRGEKMPAGTILVPESEAARTVEQWTRGAHIVGAVPNFDAETLAAMLLRHRLCPAWHYHLIDVENLIVGWLAAKGLESPLPWKSDELSEAVSVAPPSDQERHTAMGDAWWAMRIYDRIVGGVA